MEKEFLGDINFNISSRTVGESCPSNIALIKYWGNMRIRYLPIKY